MEEERARLIEYLEANDLKYVEKEHKIIHACLNPNHLEKNPSSFTSFKDNLPFTHCASCKFHLNTEKFYKFLELGVDNDMIFKSIIEKMLKDGDIKPEQEAKVYLPLQEGLFNKEYRGISVETFNKVGAYYTDPDAYYGKRIIFPIRDINKSLKGFEAVSTNKDRIPKVLRNKSIDTSELFGFEHLIEGDTVFITEGLFSALSFYELGYVGIYNFGVASIKEKARVLLQKGIKNVCLAFDYDDVGRQCASESFKVLRNTFNVFYFSYPFGSSNKADPNDLLKQGKLKDAIEYTLTKNMLKVS